MAAAIETAEAKRPEISDAITATREAAEQSKADLKQGHEDHDAAKAATAEATGIRRKEAAALLHRKPRRTPIPLLSLWWSRPWREWFSERHLPGLRRELVKNDKVESSESDRQDVAPLLPKARAAKSPAIWSRLAIWAKRRSST